MLLSTEGCQREERDGKPAHWLQLPGRRPTGQHAVRRGACQERDTVISNAYLLVFLYSHTSGNPIAELSDQHCRMLYRKKKKKEDK